MFDDRIDAGIRLGAALEKYRADTPLVLGIPRGGVIVGYYAAAHIAADFSVIVARKLPFPGQPEAGFGAIAEDGSVYLNDYAQDIAPDEIRRIQQQQKEEVRRRVLALRKGEPLPPMMGRTVIIVDDGIAMGSTARAAIMLCRNKEAGKIVIAAPISAEDTAAEMKRLADDAVILETPAYFHAVAQGYRVWSDVPEKEVIRYLKKVKAQGSRE